MHTGVSIAIDVAKVSHRAGIQTAETAAVFGGSVSIVKNLVSICKGETDPEDAVMNVAKDTAMTATVGYGTGAFGASVKGAMQNSKSEYVQMFL